MLTTKLDYKINYNKLEKEYDFYNLGLSSNKGKNIGRDLNKFHEDFDFPENVWGYGVRIFCVPKNTLKNKESEFYNITKVNNIRELDDDLILNLLCKISIAFKEIDRYSLGQNLFYFIDFKNSKKQEFLRGVEPYIKNGILELNRANYRLVSEDSKLFKDSLYHFSTSLIDGKPVIKNNLSGRYIRKAYGKGTNSGTIDLFDFDVSSKEDMDKTKLAAAYYLLKMINKSGYAKIKFKELKVINKETLKEENYKKNVVKQNIVKKIKEANGIYIREHISNKEAVLNWKKAILSYLPELDEKLINIGKPLENQSGFDIHYDEEYYKEIEKEDVYLKITNDNSSVKQSITFVEDILNGSLIQVKKGKEVLSPLITKCLTELCIKLDIFNKTKPTFASYEPTIGYGYCNYEGSDFLFKYTDEGDGISTSFHDLDDDFVNDFNKNEYYIKNENIKISICNEKIIPNIFLAYEILEKIDGFKEKEYSNEALSKWIKTVKHEKILERYERLENKKIYNYKDIKKLLNFISAVKHEDVYNSFYDIFKVFPKDSIRFAYKGENVIEATKNITLFEDNLYTIGSQNNAQNMKEFQTVFKLNYYGDELDNSKKFELIRRLHGHYYIQTNSATTKPFFMKYLRESVKSELFA